jgi:sorting nexin-8
VISAYQYEPSSGPRKVDFLSSFLPQLYLETTTTILTGVSVEQVALLAQQNTLPEPTLDLNLLSYIPAPPSSLSAAYTNTNNRQPGTTQNSSNNGSAMAVRSTSTPAPVVPAVVAPPPDDPWMTGPRYGGAGAGAAPFGVGGINGGVAPPSSVAGSGLPSGWWKRQERVTVQFAGQQGFVLNRYMVYGISTEVRPTPVGFH